MIGYDINSEGVSLKTDELHNTRYDCMYNVAVATRNKRQLFDDSLYDVLLEAISNAALEIDAEIISMTLASNLLQFEIIVPPSKSVTKSIKYILKDSGSALAEKFPDVSLPVPMFARTMQIVTAASPHNKPADIVNYLNGVKRYFRDKQGSYT